MKHPTHLRWNVRKGHEARNSPLLKNLINRTHHHREASASYTGRTHRLREASLFAAAVTPLELVFLSLLGTRARGLYRTTWLTAVLNCLVFARSAAGFAVDSSIISVVGASRVPRRSGKVVASKILRVMVQHFFQLLSPFCLIKSPDCEHPVELYLLLVFDQIFCRAL